MREVITSIAVLLSSVALAQPAPSPSAGVAGTGAASSGSVPRRVGSNGGDLPASLGPNFRAFPHDRFLVYSDCGQETHRYLRVVDRTATEFARFVERLGFVPEAPDSSVPTVVFFAEAGDYADFASRSERLVNAWMGGYYSVHNNRLVVYDERSTGGYRDSLEKLASYELEANERLREGERAGAAGEGLRQAASEAIEKVRLERERLNADASRACAEKVVHETAHMLAYNWGLQSPYAPAPFWVSEGLATNFETSEPERAFGPDHLDARRFGEYAQLARRGRLLPIVSLVQLQSAPSGDRDAAHDLYVQAYVLFNYLYRFKRDELALYFTRLRESDGPRAEPGAPRAEFAPHFLECFGAADALERAVLADAERQSAR